MKKSFLTITFILSILFVSCASKDVPAAEIIPDAPVIIEDMTSQEEENILNEETADEVTIEDEESTESEYITAEEYDLEEIDEPVVITLEPEFIPEPLEAEESEKDTEPEPEPIEVETPPVIDEISDLESSEDDITTPENSSVENTDDEVEDVIDVSETDENDIVVSEQNAIDITEENSENTMDSELVIEEIVPSRKVTLKKQEYVDITYPGTGWVFMGLTDGSKDLAYFGRKLGTQDTKFTLQARNSGTKIAHFYKNDSLTNQYIDDYIEIEILSEKGSNKNHIEAPAYKQPVPKKAKEILKKQEAPENEEFENTENLNSTAGIELEKPESEGLKEIAPPPVPVYKGEPVSLDSQKTSEIKNEVPDTNLLLKEAKLLYNEKEYKAALDKLNVFFEYATSKRDEALYLQGQVLEAKSEVQNIKAALESYTTLTKNYPASKCWDDANKRIIYLKRFYFGG